MAMSEERMQEMMAGLEGREPKNAKLRPTTEPDPEPELDEEQRILFEGGGGEAVNPQEIMSSVNARVAAPQLGVSTKMLRMLPALARASQDPSLPASVRDYYRTVVLAIEARRSNG